MEERKKERKKAARNMEERRNNMGAMECQRADLEMESAAALEQLLLVFVWLESFEARGRSRERAEEQREGRRSVVAENLACFPFFYGVLLGVLFPMTFASLFFLAFFTSLTEGDE